MAGSGFQPHFERNQDGNKIAATQEQLRKDKATQTQLGTAIETDKANILAAEKKVTASNVILEKDAKLKEQLSDVEATFQLHVKAGQEIRVLSAKIQEDKKSLEALKPEAKK